MASDSQLTTIDSDASSPATAENTMQAIVQDAYGSADVLRLAGIASNSKLKRSSKPSYDDATATRLWQVSGDLVGLSTVADSPLRPPFAPKIQGLPQ